MSVAVSSEKLGQPKDVSGLSQYFFHSMSCKGCWHQLHRQPTIFVSFVDIELKVVHREDTDKFVAVFTMLCARVGTNMPNCQILGVCCFLIANGVFYQLWNGQSQLIQSVMKKRSSMTPAGTGFICTENHKM